MDDVRRALAEARALGFLGPGPLEPHIASAAVFADALGEVAYGLDLGSGGGVPGLLLAETFPTSRWVLLDVNRRRTSFLARVVAGLGWSDRVQVVRSPAEEAAHSVSYRSQFDAVTARSFGRPSTTAETAAGFLVPEGRLVVAEPPIAAPARWPDALAQVGLAFEGLIHGAAARVAVIRRVADVPEDVPRPARSMERSPLW